MQKIATVRDVVVTGKRVLLRTSLNVPIAKDGSVADEFRLQAALPTIDLLAAAGAHVVVLAHLGRKGDSLAPVVAKLASLTKTPIRFFGGPWEEAFEESKKIAAGECLVLENVRRDEREEANDSAFAALLAQFGEVFVNDAFADSHRAHASIVGVAALLPSYAGLLMDMEVAKLSEALTPTHPSLAIIGGAKFETKIPLLTKLVAIYDGVLLGGALANDMLKARGGAFGDSLVSGEPVPTVLAGESRIGLPADLVVFNPEEQASRNSQTNDVHISEKIVDVGSNTAQLWGEKIKQASFILWNGPVGIYEDGYTVGTDALAQAIEHFTGHAVIGGGDTAAAVAKVPFDNSKVFVSTGGGAMLEFLADGTLVGLEALQNSPKVA